jgi:hypothetical protein
MPKGYSQHRRGVQEHVRDGRMSMLDYAFHSWLIQNADPSTGILFANAPQLAYESNTSRKLVQKYLCRLERGNYIKRFPRPRSHAKYPILINRFRCSRGPQKGMHLNAAATTNWTQPVYVTVSRAVSTEVSTQLHKERARGDFRDLEKNTKPKTRPQTPRAPSTPPVPESEKRRRIEERDRRLQQEQTVKANALVGEGPPLAPDVALCCLECHRANPTDWKKPWDMGSNQLNRCLAGKGPRGADTYCPRNPKRVTTDTVSAFSTTA